MPGPPSMKYETCKVKGREHMVRVKDRWVRENSV